MLFSFISYLANTNLLPAHNALAIYWRKNEPLRLDGLIPNCAISDSDGSIRSNYRWNVQYKLGLMAYGSLLHGLHNRGNNLLRLHHLQRNKESLIILYAIDYTLLCKHTGFKNQWIDAAFYLSLAHIWHNF